MYNEKVAEFLQNKYGEEKFKIYCQMEADSKEMITAEIRRVQGVSSMDDDFDAFFWKNRYEELLKQENH